MATQAVDIPPRLDQLDLQVTNSGAEPHDQDIEVVVLAHQVGHGIDQVRVGLGGTHVLEVARVDAVAVLGELLAGGCAPEHYLQRYRACSVELPLAVAPCRTPCLRLGVGGGQLVVPA